MKSHVARGLMLGMALLSGCTQCGREEEKEDPPPPCTAGTQCDDGKACETVGTTTETRCVAPLVIRGTVVRASDESAIEGVQVMAFASDGTPDSAPVLTDAQGAYELQVYAPRDDSGAPLAASVTLRAAAQGFEAFPSPLRPALPVQLAGAVEMDGRRVVMSDLTRITLAALDVSGAGSISGTVVGTGDKGGILITAQDAREATGLRAITDATGAFTVFNVPAGTYTVRGYAAGVQLVPAADVVVTAGMETVDVELAPATVPLATVSGSITPVAGGCSQGTSVVLVPRESLPVGTTFPLTAVNAVRAEVPRGLRAPPPPTAPNLSGAYTIQGVPDGRYVVLAAWENDPSPCVFDPSNIGGALYIKEITVPDGASRALQVEAFKVTGAVLITSPGSGDEPELVDSLVPTFTWQEYSSAKNYQVAVFDASGSRVWVTTVCADNDSGCSAGSSPSITYGTAGAGTTMPATAPALMRNSIYQWRVIAMGSRNGSTCGFPGVELTNDRECISISEDLRGVFRTPE